MKPVDMNFIQSVIWNLQSMRVASLVSIILILIASAYIATKVMGENLWNVLSKLGYISTRRLGKNIGKRVRRMEGDYRRSVDIGKYSSTSNKVKWYKFLSELIIDLGLKNKGATPYSFLFIMCVVAFLTSILTTEVLFGNSIIGIIMSPIFFVFLMCVAYTKANLAHDARIDAIIEAENIISNNIKGGVVKAVKENISLIPDNIRDSYLKFLDDVEQRSTHIVVALSNLEESLGSVSEEFIAKCKVYESAETYGMVGMFQDVVEINNIKTKFRTTMKNKFEEVVMAFTAGALVLSAFLLGFIALYDQLSTFYFTTMAGQILLSFDMLIFVLEFVFLTYLRAQEI